MSHISEMMAREAAASESAGHRETAGLRTAAPTVNVRGWAGLAVEAAPGSPGATSGREAQC
jgi:hypothetical protein